MLLGEVLSPQQQQCNLPYLQFLSNLIVEIFFELLDLRFLCFTPLFSRIAQAYAESPFPGALAATSSGSPRLTPPCVSY